MGRQVRNNAVECPVEIHKAERAGSINSNLCARSNPACPFSVECLFTFFRRQLTTFDIDFLDLTYRDREVIALPKLLKIRVGRKRVDQYGYSLPLTCSSSPSALYAFRI